MAFPIRTCRLRPEAGKGGHQDRGGAFLSPVSQLPSADTLDAPGPRLPWGISFLKTRGSDAGTTVLSAPASKGVQ